MKKILFALPFIAALTACGGGGSGGGSSPAPSQDKTTSEQPVTQTKEVVISETGTESLFVSNSSELVYNVKNDSEIALNTSTNSSSDLPQWLSISEDSGSFIFNVTEVDRPYNIIIEFRNKDTNKVVFEVSLFVGNDSAKELVSQVERAISQSDSLLALENDKKIYFYIVDLLYLSDNSVTYKDKQSYLENFNVREFSTYQAFSDAIDDLKNGLENYNKGKNNVTDSALESHLENFENTLLAHGRMASGMIEFLQSDVNNTGIVMLPNTDMNYAEKEKLYSRFIGNENYGQWVDGNWIYNSGFEFLSSIVNVNLAGTCSI